MIKKRTASLCFLWLCLGFISCNKENAPDFLQSTGKDVLIYRPVTESFHSIKLQEGVDLEITQSLDDHFEITLHGGKNLLPDVETSISNNVLTINNKNKFNWVRSYKRRITAHVTLPHFWKLSTYSSGLVTATDTIRCDSTQIESWSGSGTIDLPLVCNVAKISLQGGATDIKLRGRANMSQLYNISFGPFRCENFFSDIIYMYTKSTNDNYVFPHVLYYEIEGKGNIYYRDDIVSLVDGTNKGGGKAIRWTAP